MLEVLDKKRIVILVLSAIVLMFSLFSSIPKPNDSLLHDEPGKSWVKINPIQCLGNPWERYWLESEDKENQDYPVWQLRKFGIVKDYYAEQNIKIHSIKSEITQEVVCKACSCPTGETLYLQVYDAEVEKMEGLGYELTD